MPYAAEAQGPKSISEKLLKGKDLSHGIRLVQACLNCMFDITYLHVIVEMRSPFANLRAQFFQAINLIKKRWNHSIASGSTTELKVRSL